MESNVEGSQIRSYAPVLNLVILELNVFPVGVKYHRKCYQSFTHKLPLGKLSENQSKYSYKIKKNIDRLLAKLEKTDTYIISPETITRRTSSSSKENLSNVSCYLLPNKCIFCDKEVKYVKRKREFLRKCVVEQAKSKILQHAKEKNDFYLIALASTNDLIAAEAQYHPSCYTHYTCPVSGKKWLKNLTIKSLN